MLSCHRSSQWNHFYTRCPIAGQVEFPLTKIIGSCITLRSFWQFYWCFLLIFKGQLISKCIFVCTQFFQKLNENKLNWGIIIVKLNFFVRFLEELRIPKKLLKLTDLYTVNWKLSYCEFIKFHSMELKGGWRNLTLNRSWITRMGVTTPCWSRWQPTKTTLSYRRNERLRRRMSQAPTPASTWRHKQ